jgi:hypothetical protein
MNNRESIAFGHPGAEKYWRQVNNSDIHVVSTSTDDDVAGVGAQTIWARGVDAGGARMDATVDLDGTTSVSLFTGTTIDELRVITRGTNNDSNVGTISCIRTESAHTAGVPSNNNQVFAHISPTRSAADVSYWSLPTGIKLYPVSISVTTTAPTLVQVSYSLVGATGFTGAVNTIVFEAIVDGCTSHDLRHLGAWEEAGIQVFATAVSGSVDVSFSLTAFTDEDLSTSDP